ESPTHFTTLPSHSTYYLLSSCSMLEYIPYWKFNCTRDDRNHGGSPWPFNLNMTISRPRCLGHQTQHQILQHGSICESNDKVTCPVLEIGGSHNGCFDGVARMITGMKNSPSKGQSWAKHTTFLGMGLQ
ncbi:hypothetical protein PF007_g32069, partial [Phytophthora fragariae]